MKNGDRVTYIKPETEPNQSLTLIRETLQSGITAAHQQDWLSVSNYLKLLPQTQSSNKATLFVLQPQEWQVAYELARKMLLDADFQHKWAICKIMPWLGKDIVPDLITLLQDETTQADVRWFICHILGNFKTKQTIVALVELLRQTTDPELIEVAGKTLTEIGDDAIEALEDLLTQPQYRLLAVQSLSYIRTAKTIEPLLKITDAPEAELRAIAIKALGSFHDSRIPPVLVAALRDKASKVRVEAASALGFRPDLCDELNLVSHLSVLLSDFNLEVCRQGTVSLGRMKREAASEALFKTLQSSTTPVSLKLDAVKALGWSEISPAISYLGKALANSTVPVEREIIIILGRISVPELKLQATRVLLEFWRERHQQLEPQLRQVLATSLGELGCNEARTTLKLLAQDSDRKVKLHALAALKKTSHINN